MKGGGRYWALALLVLLGLTAVAVRESFSREVHGRATSAVKAYWQQEVFSGRAVPPPEVASGADVVARVRARRGAIDYVSARTHLGDGVKAI